MCVAVEAVEGGDLKLDALRRWAHDYLAPYKVPKELLVLDGLTRNAMGKVMKPTVIELFNSSAETK